MLGVNLEEQLADLDNLSISKGKSVTDGTGKETPGTSSLNRVVSFSYDDEPILNPLH